LREAGLAATGLGAQFGGGASCRIFVSAPSRNGCSLFTALVPPTPVFLSKSSQVIEAAWVVILRERQRVRKLLKIRVRSFDKSDTRVRDRLKTLERVF